MSVPLGTGRVPVRTILATIGLTLLTSSRSCSCSASSASWCGW